MNIHRLIVIIVSLLFLTFWSALAGSAESDYQIGPGDVLKISIYDHPDLMTVARVDNEGYILLPLAGRVQVGGLTPSSASQTIAAALGDDYIVNPQASVFVQEFRSKKVFIIGEVVRPGLYELSGPTTLLELVSKAGGLTRGAGHNATIRRNGANGTAGEKNIEVNIAELLQSGSETVNLLLLDGDSITIPKAAVIYVTGQVNRPSALPVEPDTTVIKAITMAGGFTALASQGKIKIIRKINGVEQILEKVPLHEKLMPEDVMVVPESFF
ncbi:MAG: periplasmic polysaccharide biosynthesis/export protein [Deltaproteobacteria bacterium HGW-Deltaproteobacteria-4]|nr:MAG: periplasmic polysaccharide biosynthesis/export protein [Deltaproteobacteria bacterium HGW-Deltaproteobacteria-4]